LGQNPRILKSGEIPAEEYRRLWETITAGQEWRGTFHNRKKNGELFWESASIAPVVDDNGQITHYVAVKEDITERRRAEEAVRESERHYRRFVERNAAGVLRTDPDGQILECNQTLAGMFGYDSPEELKTRCVTELYFNLADRQVLLDHFKDQPVLTGYEICFKRKDGSLLWVIANLSLYHGENGATDFLEGTLIDITEHKCTEQLLEFIGQEGWAGYQDELEFLARLTEHIGRALAVDYFFIGRLKDAQTVETVGFYAKGKIVPDIEFITRGTPCGNVVGKALCHYGDKLPELFPADARLVQMGAQSYLGIPLTDSAGKPLGLMAVLDTKPMSNVRLATALLEIASIRAAGELERLTAAAALRESEQRYRQLVEMSPDAIFINSDGRLVFVNPAGLKLIGATQPEQLLHRPALDLIHPKYREKVAARLTAVLAERRTVPLTEEQFVRLDGTTVAVEITAIPFVSDDQPAALVVVRDITERKKLEAQFLRAQRMESLGKLASGIAHDLNNTLTPILLSLEMLKEKVTDAEDLKSFAMLEAGVQRSASLVKQVLTFGRGVEGQRITVKPMLIVREIEEIIRETFPKSVVFECQADPDLWLVTGDATQLQQVLLNLCINARDAMPQGGNLGIRLANVVLDQIYAGMNLEAKPGPYVVIKVEDTGVGIPPEIRDRIFDPFFTTKEPGKGTGLGLATVLGVVKSHGGFINCYSELGKGTKFNVYLPGNATPGVAETVAVEQSLLPRGHGELVLFVDDEEAIRKVSQKTLERFG
jgi:PAS domain S-box-containing protein